MYLKYQVFYLVCFSYDFLGRFYIRFLERENMLMFLYGFLVSINNYIYILSELMGKNVVYIYCGVLRKFKINVIVFFLC